MNEESHVRLDSYAEDMSTCTLTNEDGIGYFYDRVDLAEPAIHPLQQTLRDNGDLIALQATVAQQAKMIEHLRGENDALRQDAELLNWLDKRSIPVVAGQCWSCPEGELWGYSWTVAGQCSTVREAIECAMSKEG